MADFYIEEGARGQAFYRDLIINLGVKPNKAQIDALREILDGMSLGNYQIFPLEENGEFKIRITRDSTITQNAETQISYDQLESIGLQFFDWILRNPALQPASLSSSAALESLPAPQAVARLKMDAGIMHCSVESDTEPHLVFFFDDINVPNHREAIERLLITNGISSGFVTGDVKFRSDEGVGGDFVAEVSHLKVRAGQGSEPQPATVEQLRTIADNINQQIKGPQRSS